MEEFEIHNIANILDCLSGPLLFLADPDSKLLPIFLSKVVKSFQNFTTHIFIAITD